MAKDGSKKHGIKTRRGAKAAAAAAAEQAAFPEVPTLPSAGVPVVGSVMLRQLHSEDDPDLDARARIVIHLTDKIDGLIGSEAALNAVANATTDDAERSAALARRTNAQDERELCRSRVSAINHDGPFTDPGREAENALLAALDAVTRATANTKAISALLEATHGLIQAYSAKSTEA